MQRTQPILRTALVVMLLAPPALPLAASPAAPQPGGEPAETADGPQTPDRAEIDTPESPERLPEVTIVGNTTVIRAPRTGPRTSPSGLSGVRAVLNPNTGSLVSMPRASREDLLPMSERLQRGLSTSHEGLQEVRLPDGTVAVHLQGRFLSALTATVSDGGEIAVGHGRIDPETGAIGLGDAPMERDPRKARATEQESGSAEPKGAER